MPIGRSIQGRSIVGRNVVGRSIQGAALQRYILTFSAAGSMYGELTSPVTLSGDFEINLDAAVVANVGTAQTLVASDNYTTGLEVFLGVNRDALRINAWDGSSIQTSAMSVGYDDGKIRTLMIKRSGSTITVEVEGSSISVTSNSSFDLRYLAQRGDNTRYSEMAPLGMKVWTGGDSSTGTLVVNEDFNTDLSSATTDYFTFFNTTTADSELFTRVGNSWVGPGGSPVLEYA